MNRTFFRPALYVSTALSLALNAQALAGDAQAAASAAGGEEVASDIIVTARRVEERLQDVPISITVFNQEQLNNNNVVSAKDLSTYTPSMTVNSRYGGDNTSFTIRGFTQEQRTTPTVAVYFADVIAPRSSGQTPGGEGAGPGSFFDLQNVQVLKGPTGTLFGRNTTGGAVLLVPRRPTDDLEGYIEGSYGNYDMRRLQAVLNMPVSDTFRARAGIDSMQRDGYLKNLSPVGPKAFNDVDYIAARLSVIGDLTPNLENYLIATYTHSKNNGSLAVLKKCSPAAPGAFGALACDQVARQAGRGFWTTGNSVPDPVTRFDQWQLINTTTWTASDTLTVKNIAAYGQFTGNNRNDLFGADFVLPEQLAVGGGRFVPTGSAAGTRFGFVSIRGEPTVDHVNDQSTFSEELRFQGRSGDDRLHWQAGAYLELSNPLGYAGVQNPTLMPCADPDLFQCTDVLGRLLGIQGRVGSMTRSLVKTRYRDYALYGQASYDLTDQLTFTAGLRYTWDEVKSEAFKNTIRFFAPNTPTLFCTDRSTQPGGSLTTTNPVPFDQLFTACRRVDAVSTSAPTWLLNLDYKPIDDVLLYAKWARGYRQGSTSPLAAEGFNTYDEEKVDNYEVGAKTSWRGPVPGSFNIAGFYNDFVDQQLQIGFQGPGITPTIGILNAGKSRIYGLEAEATLSPVEGLNLSASYAYLNSRLQKYTPPSPEELAATPYTSTSPAVVGQSLPFTIPHKFAGSVNYTLPLPDTVGQITAGGTYTRQSRYLIINQPNGRIPGYDQLNLHLSWEAVGGSPIDASLFATNVLNKKYFTHVNDQADPRNNNANNRGFVSYYLGEPRMYGLRVRLRFGS